jgi:hypothetical protein
MATAIEYGLIAALITVAAAAAVSGLNREEPAKAKTASKPSLFTVVASDPDRYEKIVRENRSGCHLIDDGYGLRYRLRSDGTTDCPGVPRLKPNAK